MAGAKPAKVNAPDGLNLRERPTTASKTITVIPHNSQISVSSIVSTPSDGYNWARIQYKDKNGYAAIPFIRYIDLAQADSKPTPKPDSTGTAGDPAADAFAMSAGLDQSLSNMLNYVSGTNGAFKGTMNLFGSPFQFTHVVDYRVPNVSPLLGRTYIENIAAEAPICTLIPGKPEFLPGAKNKQGTGRALLSGANGSFKTLKDLKLDQSELRYFDFTSDYIEYIKYVNMLCRTSAGFLELAKTEFRGTQLGSYDWANYRYDSDKYYASISTLASGIGSGLGSVVQTISNGIKDLMGKSPSNSGEVLVGDKGSTDNGTQGSVEALFSNMNFLQFYVDPSTGKSEHAGNATSTSKLESLMDSASDLSKELAFVANSGGIDSMALQESTGDTMNAISGMIPGDGALKGFISRILNTGGTIIKGENLILPEVYQRSDYSESYQLVVNLKSPYMDKLSYYINIVVPLMHLLALVLPKQSTANSYAAPFLIKGYVPGVFTCNMGIVESINIDKAPSGDTWSVDGYPAEVRVSLSIKDLYSAMSMTPSNNPKLFIANSSLIDYIAVTAGVDLTKPQLVNRVSMVLSTFTESFKDVPDNVAAIITEGAHKYIEAFYKLS